MIWPHVKAIEDLEPVWLEFEVKVPDALAIEPTLPEFLDKHIDHELTIVDARNMGAAR